MNVPGAKGISRVSAVGLCSSPGEDIWVQGTRQKHGESNNLLRQSWALNPSGLGPGAVFFITIILLFLTRKFLLRSTWEREKVESGRE